MRIGFLWAFFAIALASCSGEQSGGEQQPPSVTVATPLEREVRDWDEYIGRFEAEQDAQIRPRVSGQIDRIYMEDGQDVRRGQPLLRIDPRPFEAALNEARAGLVEAEANRRNAEQIRDRSLVLREADAISQEELETAETSLRTAAATVAAARALVESRRLELGFTTIRAPFSGRVSARAVSLGDFVTSGTTVLTRIVSLDPIRFAFDGAETFYLDYMRQGDNGDRAALRSSSRPIEISLADEENYEWRGDLSFVDNAITPNSGTIDAYALIANPTGFLTPGLFGRARLLGSGTYKALLVPAAAVVTDQDRRLVYALNNNDEVVAREVTLGPMVDGLRVIRDGLAPTERILLDGVSSVQPGTKVSPSTGSITASNQQAAPDAQPAEAPEPAAAESTDESGSESE